MIRKYKMSIAGRFGEKRLLRLSLMLLAITSIELFSALMLSNMMQVVATIMLVLYVIKVLLIYKMVPTLTSPLLLPTVAIAFWYVGGNYLNLHNARYLYEEHGQLITLLISTSYLFFIFGSVAGSFFKPWKIKRHCPYVENNSLISLLYIISIVSFIGAGFYVYPIIRAIIDGSYFLNRIDMIFGRGYLSTLGMLHTFALPFLVMLKLSTGSRLSYFDKFLILVSFLFVIIPLHRGPLLTQVLMYLFIYNDFYRKISLKKITILVVSIIVILGIIIPNVRGIDRPILIILGNEIGVHMWNLSRYIDMVDATGAFGFKPIIMALMIPLPGHQDSFEIWIKQFSDISVDIGGASMTLIGEGFMEFKWVGVMGSFFILGVVLVVLSKNRWNSTLGYMFYIYLLNRSESIIQFGFAKVLVTLIISGIFFSALNLCKLEMNRNVSCGMRRKNLNL